MDKAHPPRRRPARRVPLSELGSDEVAERSVQADVPADPMDEVCCRLAQLRVPAPRRMPHRRHPRAAPSPSKRRAAPLEFTVFEDPCAVHGLDEHMQRRQTRAMTAAHAHDYEKENHLSAT